jgi:hypothetical protein
MYDCTYVRRVMTTIGLNLVLAGGVSRRSIRRTFPLRLWMMQRGPCSAGLPRVIRRAGCINLGYASGMITMVLDGMLTMILEWLATH